MQEMVIQTDEDGIMYMGIIPFLLEDVKII